MGIVSFFPTCCMWQRDRAGNDRFCHRETLMLVNSDAIGSITDRMNEYFGWQI